MARWYRRYRRYGSYSRRGGRKWSPVTQVVQRITGAGQSSQPVAINRLNDSTQNTYPLGPIMKVKNFRINVVFASSVSVLWALVYVPEGMPIGTLSAAPTTTNIAASLSSSSSRAVCTECGHEFGNECRAAESVDPGPARNLNPGDAIFFIWRPSRTSQGSTPSSRSTTRAV